MATPAWVRRHRTDQHISRTIALTELALQAETRVTVETEDEHTEDWTLRRGMRFAGEI